MSAGHGTTYRRFVSSRMRPESSYAPRKHRRPCALPLGWDHFRRWCDQHGFPALPATAELVALYQMAVTGHQRPCSSLPESSARLR
jgi:hypothetical protein